MEIKGAYSEHQQEQADWDVVESYAPDFWTMTGTTAGKYCQQRASQNCFAFRPQGNAEEILSDFVSSLKKKKASQGFIDAAATAKVEVIYLPVEYFTVTQYEKTNMVSRDHYRTTGYTATGRIEGDTVQVNVTPEKTYSHTTYDFEKKRKSAKDAVYYSALEKDLEKFASRFYTVEERDASELVIAEEIMECPVLPCLGANSYKHPEYGSARLYEIHQVLLFPLWRITVEHQKHVYVNYASDIATSRAVYFPYSTKKKNQLLSDYAEAQRRYSRVKSVANAVHISLFVLNLITLVIHFFGSVAAADSKGYSGFLYRQMGGFGTFLTLLGGFAMIGYAFFLGGFVGFVQAPIISEAKLRAEEIKLKTEEYRQYTPKLNQGIWLSLIGTLLAVGETVLFLASIFGKF